MRIAITGSNGMIGKILTKNLQEKGHEIVECTKEKNNIMDKENLKKAFKGCKIVIHLAAQLNENANDLWEINVKGTENCLEAAEEAKIDQFIYASTAGVYGLQPGLKDETTQPKPETKYEKSKYEAEKKVQERQELFHITILRPAIIVGENEYWKKIIEKIKKNYPIVGQGKNIWQMITAKDTAKAFEFCCNNENCYGETFIIAHPKKITLEELVNTIRKELGMKKVKKIPLWLGMAIAEINQILKISKDINKAYIQRMQAERNYSTQKIESIGWKAEQDPIKELIKITKKI
ncbi:MAG: NAD(P)-dependent oxidoreductase [Candidatus Diapherotrites archaeon]